MDILTVYSFGLLILVVSFLLILIGHKKENPYKLAIPISAIFTAMLGVFSFFNIETLDDPLSAMFIQRGILQATFGFVLALMAINGIIALILKVNFLDVSRKNAWFYIFGFSGWTLFALWAITVPISPQALPELAALHMISAILVGFTMGLASVFWVIIQLRIYKGIYLVGGDIPDNLTINGEKVVQIIYVRDSFEPYRDGLTITLNENDYHVPINFFQLKNSDNKVWNENNSIIATKLCVGDVIYVTTSKEKLGDYIIELGNWSKRKIDNLIGQVSYSKALADKCLFELQEVVLTAYPVIIILLSYYLVKFFPSIFPTLLVFLGLLVGLTFIGKVLANKISSLGKILNSFPRFDSVILSKEPTTKLTFSNVNP